MASHAFAVGKEQRSGAVQEASASEDFTDLGAVAFDSTPGAEGSSLDKVLVKLRDDDFKLARRRLSGTGTERAAAVDFARKQLKRGDSPISASAAGRRGSWLACLCESDVGTYKLLEALEQRGVQRARDRNGSTTETYFIESETDLGGRGGIDAGYVLVEHSDVLDAVLDFLTEAVKRNPEAENWTSEQLHAALVEGLMEIRNTPAIVGEGTVVEGEHVDSATVGVGGRVVGAVRALWGWGGAISSWVSTGYNAWRLYTNPWLVRALVRGLWTSCRYLVGAR